MSFVLDALRRAEAERQRGNVPGLHAQTLAPAGEPVSDRRRRAWVVPIGVGLAAGLLAAVLVGGWWSPAAPTAPAAGSAVAPAVPAPAPAVAPAASPGVAQEAASAAVAVAPGSLPARSGAPAPVAVAPAQATGPRPDVSRPAPGPSTTPAPLVRPVPAALDGASKATARPERVRRFQELPDAVRRQIPAMAFGGATDSPDRSARMLLINGQIWREGDEPANGLRLERISLRSAVFLWREERFEVAY